ncbi:tryptophan 2,3-dioxygenase family protein [Amycolatopsis sp. NPDC058986]|uniref:tryptophan 2,3-dioxygenase family protein n=1 Tax=unclassified Amycolatopsis TaxID=2618356 RepID=UPI00366C6649
MRPTHSPLRTDEQERNRPEPTYGGYLAVDGLLRLQRPRSVPEHPDELHFIVTHQAMELWFKVVIHELGRVRAELGRAEWTRAVARLGRINAILAAQTAQLGTLGHLDPQAFLEFRGFLGTASGFQSVQFRVIEVLSGLRDSGYLNVLRAAHGGSLPAEIVEALATPGLAEIAGGAADWRAVYSRPDAQGALFLLGEALLDYDRLWAGWRHEHLVLVERIIGYDTRGTGGASARYLRGRLSSRFFPFLWEVRHRLATEHGA